MKKLGIYILSICLAFVYVMSVVGVGVHTCQHSGKRQVVLLAPEACTCCGHEHEKAASCAVEDESCCGNENHCCREEERCCEVAYQVLKVDQEVHSAKSLLKNVTEYFTWLFTPAMALELPHAAAAMAFNHTPPPLTVNTLPDIYRLSQLRL
ncbi:MAG: hypothetical protein LBF69_03150 [Prevotellaceae bacterium]|jgi:hypothetical protein|nr:hypothetical protein [Prevotellaceae bacterium]